MIGRPAAASLRSLASLDIVCDYSRCLVSDASCSLRTWGRGIEGALGDGSGRDTTRPLQLKQQWPTASSQVFSGMWHSGALVDGSLYMWGKGKSGRLGFGDEDTVYEPANVPIQGRVASVSLGGQHTMAVVDPTVETQSSREIDDSSGTQFTHHEDFPISPFHPYKLLTWGMGDFGCLGLCHESHALVPTEVQALETLTDLSYLQLPIVNQQPVISAGGQHSLVTDRFGRVFACGRDDGDGRLGLKIPTLESTNVISMFFQVALPEAVVQVAAGGYTSFALTVSGKLYAWGSNGNGEQGCGEWVWSGSRPNLVNQLSDGRVKQFSAGGFHAAAVTHDGEVYTWGLGRHGALGHGSSATRHTPARITALRGVNITQVMCGPTSTMAVDVEGNVYGWGNNSQGLMLGVGDTSPDCSLVLEPTLISSLTRTHSIALGAMHGLAICD